MNFYLLTTYHEDKNPARAIELLTCLKINNLVFTKIILFGTPSLEVPIENPAWFFTSDRPYFRDMLKAAEGVAATDPEAIFVIANADIFFKQETIEKLSLLNWDNIALSLSRWDVYNFDYSTHSFTEEPFCRADSQDAWIFKGKPKALDAPYKLGIPGCDNKISLFLEESGYRVFNPSLNLKIHHLHVSNVRNYYRADGMDVIERYPPPYRLIPPCTIDNVK